MQRRKFKIILQRGSKFEKIFLNLSLFFVKEQLRQREHQEKNLIKEGKW